jgi:NhaC family Na+:H+ antiporter
MPNEAASAPAPSPRDEGQEIPLGAALIPVACLIGFLAYVIIKLEGSGHLPLAMAGAVAGLVAWSYGWPWRTIHAGMLKAINLAMGAILILVVIGVLMGTWLASGIVPALIDWGLMLLSPSFFLPATCAVCSVVSLVSGSSWSTAGTVGLALIGVANAMGIDPAIAAGAVVSGAYFGDKLSPMSDTTNLAPAMAGTDLFVHIRHMVWTTGPSWVIAMIAFTFLGLNMTAGDTGTSIQDIHALLSEKYEPSVIHLVVPVVVGFMVYKKAPALPTLLLGALRGGGLALIQGVAATDVLVAAVDGYKPATGDATVDELLARGGMMSMASTVLLVLCAMVFGGIMERTGMLRVIGQRLLSLGKSSGSLVVSTVLTSMAMNVLAADQYIAVVVPGRMYAAEYEARGLHPKNLSRALEDGGTITSPLIPWNTCGAFMASTLGVATGAYLPYAFLNLVNPLIGMLYGITGWTIEKAETPATPQAAPAE